MLDFQFNVPANLYLGKDALTHLPEEVKKRTNKVMLLYGGGSIKRNGAYDAITKTLAEAGIEWVDFGGNTKALWSGIVKGVELAKREQVGCVIGIGGSTCMDMAKIVAFGAVNEGLLDYMTGRKQRDGSEPRLLIGAIPTFPSGGSEAGFGAGVDDDESGTSLDLYGYVPDFAILCPEFSYSLDAAATALGAMVTFVQVSINHMGGVSALSERITEGVLDVIRNSVEVAMLDPTNYEARANLMYASAYGTNGIPSRGKDLSWGYEIYNYSGIMRKLMGLSYRQNFVLFFPSWLKAAAKYHAEDIRKYMVRVWGVDADLPAPLACEVGVMRMKRYFAGLGIPMRYRDYGELPTREQLIAGIEAEGVENPLPMEELIAMFEDCM
ncbi:MAG: iron-containing alcohol dehydrogenase [Clostridia bacterium]|nr:iron-containing alcohol dehydrogenase [Clostridia bacterium]